MAFDVSRPLDAKAMTRTVNRFFKRHDTFSSWFAISDDGHVQRHVLADGVGNLLPQSHGYFERGHMIRELVEQSTPGPFQWDCFTVGTIDRGDGFTVFLAVDHLHSDGISQALSCVDLMSIYVAETDASANTVGPAGSYIDYCRRERELSMTLTLADPQVDKWVSLLEANNGRLPAFSLPLGLGDAGHRRSASITVDVFGELSARQIDQTCQAHGARFVSGVLAAAALAAYEFSGNTRYFGFTPKSTRTTAAEFSAVGWFTNLIPVNVDLTPSSTFTEVVAAVHRSYTEGKSLSQVSLHRVLELLPESSRTNISPEWVVPMVSYLDVRKLPGGAMFDRLNFSVYGNRGSSAEVFLWINRFHTGTSATLLYPDTEQARVSVHRYIERFAAILTAVAVAGDYRAQSTNPSVHDSDGREEGCRDSRRSGGNGTPDNPNGVTEARL